MSKAFKKRGKKKRDDKRDVSKKSKKKKFKNEKEPSEEGKKRLLPLIALIVVIIVIIAVLSWYILGVYLPGQNGIGNGKVIEFPQDEGVHDQAVEFWRVIFLLTSTSDDKFEVSSTFTKYSPTYGGNNESLILITDGGNTTGHTYYSKRDLGTLSAEEGKLNLSYADSSGWKFDTFQQTNGFSYKYNSVVSDGSSNVVVIDLDLDHVKQPILLDGDGKIFDASKNFGTIFGYSQTRLNVEGTITLWGVTHNVQGLAWIDHQWGAWSYTQKEYWQIQLKNGYEIDFFRFYLQENLVYEDFYLIDTAGKVNRISQYDLEVLKYTIAPMDLDKKKCVSSQWRFTTSTLDFTTQYTVRNQFSTAYGWEGSIVGSGTQSGSSVSGRGYATIERTDLSTLAINYVGNDFPQPFFDTRVTANVTDDIPIAEVTLKYNTTADPTIKDVTMSYVGDDFWEGYVPAEDHPTIGYVYYWIEAYDLADKVVTSDVFDFSF